VASDLKPIFLLADSQLLFWRDDEGHRLLERARQLIEAGETGKPPKAAYLGASNGDAPEFFDLFQGAMGEIGIRDCRHVPADASPEDLAFLAAADLLLLAGGDVRRGWEAFTGKGLKDRIVERYYAGAVLVGISAGAVQLGLKGWDEKGLFDTFCLVPFVVGAHDEPTWSELLRAVTKAGEHTRGLGIPTGGGVLYHPDYSLEPVRHPATEVELTESGPRQALLFPGGDKAAEAAERPRIMSQDEVFDRVMRDLGAPSADEPDESEEPVH
jgi:cyanophycinase